MRKQQAQEDRCVDHGGPNAASAAIGYLLSYLAETARETGYHPPKNPILSQLPEDRGLAKSRVSLPAPKGGFTDLQKDSIEAYANTLTYWQRVVVEFEWAADAVQITLSPIETPTGSDLLESARSSLRDRLKGKAFAAAKVMSATLSEQAFMVREPVKVVLMTPAGSFPGYAIMVKYPMTGRDTAGIGQAYDKWVPLLADICARANKLKCEATREGVITTVFFTASRRYNSSLFDSSFALRLFIPKRRKGFGSFFVGSAPYRACKMLAQTYKKDFLVAKKPLPSWGMEGFSVVMEYRKGAAGKVVDDSYLYHVRLTTEKLMKRFRTQAAIRHHVGSRNLVVTFFLNSPDSWMQEGRFSAAGVAVVERGSLVER